MISISKLSAIKKTPWIFNIVKVFSGDIITKLLGVIISLILIRTLTIDDYAYFTTFDVMSLWLPSLFGGGINTVMIRYSAEQYSVTKQRTVNLFLFNFLFQIFLYVIFALIFVMFLDKFMMLLFKSLQYKNSFFYGIIGGFAILLSNASLAIFQAEEKFSKLIFRNWLKQLLNIIFIGTLFWLGYLNFSLAAVSVISVNFLISFLIIYYVFRDYNFFELLAHLKEFSNIFKKFVTSSGWLILYFFTLSLMSRIDVLMLTKFSPKEELANYGVALKYYSLALLILNSINIVLLPRFANISMQEESRQVQFVRNWIKHTLWIIIPVLIFAFFGKGLYVFINGAQYAKSFNIFLIFTFGVYLSLMFSPIVNVLIARKLYSFLFFVSLVALVSSYSLCYFLIPHWASYAAATIAIGGHALINITAFIKIVKEKI
ncbi:MAG TPA: oligosaccharide flippase family protein [bacterium]|nr:oligosaccharide flippase family protein [bacterium]HPN42128.1 oligosaccharide flippase family protein [bacterium]